jgi:hypothetical protein
MGGYVGVRHMRIGAPFEPDPMRWVVTQGHFIYGLVDEDSGDGWNMLLEDMNHGLEPCPKDCQECPPL